VTNESVTYDTFGAPVSFTATAAGGAVYASVLTRDAIGRVVSLSETVGGATHVRTYAYDAAGRLLAVQQDGVLVATYTYDANGARLSRGDASGVVNAAVYDAQDRLVQYGSTVFTHSLNGERLTSSDGARTTTYRYDALSNLAGATLPDGRQGDYLIDGQNRRVARRVGGSIVQEFVYQDGLRPAAELDANGAVISRFVYVGQANSPAYLVRGGATYRIISDQIGSPRLVVDAGSGAIVQRVDYDEFGNVLADTNPGFQPFGFGGGLYDRDTGLVHFGARDYDPVTGRWLTRDPAGFASGDANLYDYVHDDPVNRVDPSGLGVGFCDCEGGITCSMCRDESKVLEGSLTVQDFLDRAQKRAIGAAAGTGAVLFAESVVLPMARSIWGALAGGTATVVACNPDLEADFESEVDTLVEEFPAWQEEFDALRTAAKQVGERSLDYDYNDEEWAVIQEKTFGDLMQNLREMGGRVQTVRLPGQASTTLGAGARAGQSAGIGKGFGKW
jgi:RHS repeat-associated protein